MLFQKYVLTRVESHAESGTGAVVPDVQKLVLCNTTKVLARTIFITRTKFILLCPRSLSCAFLLNERDRSEEKFLLRDAQCVLAQLLQELNEANFSQRCWSHCKAHVALVNKFYFIFRAARLFIFVRHRHDHSKHDRLAELFLYLQFLLLERGVNVYYIANILNRNWLIIPLS